MVSNGADAERWLSLQSSRSLEPRYSTRAAKCLHHQHFLQQAAAAPSRWALPRPCGLPAIVQGIELGSGGPSASSPICGRLVNVAREAGRLGLIAKHYGGNNPSQTDVYRSRKSARSTRSHPRPTSTTPDSVAPYLPQQAKSTALSEPLRRQPDGVPAARPRH